MSGLHCVFHRQLPPGQDRETGTGEKAGGNLPRSDSRKQRHTGHIQSDRSTTWGGEARKGAGCCSLRCFDLFT